MQTLFAWILVGLVLVAGIPWAAWLLAKNPRNDGRWLTILVGVSLSLGTLTLLIFWGAVAGIPFNLWTITLPYFALMLPGWLLPLTAEHSPFLRATRVGTHVPREKERKGVKYQPTIQRRFIIFLLSFISAAILFNAVYWPFVREDARRIYGRYGRIMWSTGTLVSFERDDSFYQTYPILVPLTYTYTYLASGWQNEYLARTIPALLSLGCLPAVYILGRMIAGEATGWLSALLLALTPAFGSWASSGYVDLPMAFFYTLSAIFALRLWKTCHWTDAMLIGVMMGLAAWTKNAALLGVPILAGWLIWAWSRRKIDLGLALLALAACILIAGPWYVRNVVNAGMIIPPTAWVDQAQPTLDSILIFVTHPEVFGASGWLILSGLGASMLALLHRRNLLELSMLLWWTIPFFAAWWLFVSYDPRFLLMFAPLLVVIAAYWTVRIWSSMPNSWQTRALWPLAALAFILALLTAWNSIEFKNEILRGPLMGDEAKHEIVSGNR